MELLPSLCGNGKGAGLLSACLMRFKIFSFAGVTGEIKFLSWGDRIGKAVLVQVKADAQAPTGYNFMKK